MSQPQISVVIPTFNRMNLLGGCLESLARQTLPPDRFEVVVVDDGSTDGTATLCRHAEASVPLRYLRISNSGISAAKNAGLFASTAPLCLFYDDDDIADASLLEAHVEAHSEYPLESRAVLGYTTWSPTIDLTPVMRFVTDVGQQLFAFRDLADGQLLDHTYFWGGRSSCKRSFLVKHGIFNQDFRTIIEDIELGYRLSKFGFDVVHKRSAVSYMVRPLRFEEMCERCERKGAALWRFYRLHPAPEVAAYCGIPDRANDYLPHDSVGRASVERVRALEAGSADSTTELFEYYQRHFDASLAKGLLQAARGDGHDLSAEALDRETKSSSQSRRPASGASAHFAPAVCERPVFIVGSPRSGTSILAWALAEHTELATSAESDFLYYLFAEDDRLKVTYELAAARPDGTFLRRERVSWEEFLAHLGYGINRLFTSRTGGRRWIDQTPLYTVMVRTLVHMFPDSQFLHILRDGRRVVHSMAHFADAFREQATFSELAESGRVPTWAESFAVACRTWDDYTRIALNFGEAYPDRLLTVRHELLSREPDRVFRDVLAFLGLEYEAGPAALVRTSRLNSSFAPDYSPPPSPDDEPWTGWPDGWHATFATEAGETMVRAGYWSPEDLSVEHYAEAISET